MPECPPVEQLPVEDWADQDLLAKQDGRQRLTEEIGRSRARLDELRHGGADAEAELMLLTRRLSAMESIRGEYDTYLPAEVTPNHWLTALTWARVRVGSQTTHPTAAQYAPATPAELT